MTSESLVLLSSLILFLKHLLYYTETGIWKSRRRHLGINISTGIIFALQNVL